MEQNYWELGRWGRIPVSMHWTVLLIFVWLYLFFWDVLAAAIASVAFFALLVVHEFGHVAALRWRKIPVESIALYGIHGKTSYGYASPADEILIAWAGVGAQLLVLLVSVAIAMTVDLSGPVVSTIAGPVLVVFTRINIVLMIIALLPIGPFDGRAAWGVFAHMRAKRRKVKQRQRDIELNPEKGLAPEKRRELEESAAREAAALMEKFARKGDGRKEDA